MTFEDFENGQIDISGGFLSLQKRILKKGTSKKPAMPIVELCTYSKEVYTEADYDSYEVERKNAIDVVRMAYEYISLGGIINKHPFRVHLFSDLPIDIIDNPLRFNIRMTLEKACLGTKSEFYMGEQHRRISNIGREIFRMMVKYTYNGMKINILTPNMNRKILSLQVEMQNLFEERLIYVKNLAGPIYAELENVTFRKSNPGAQYTGSFQPIFKNSPQEYFGPRCRNVRNESIYQIKLHILCGRKFRKGSCLFFWLPIEIIKIIFEMMYDVFYRSISFC